MPGNRNANTEKNISLKEINLSALQKINDACDAFIEFRRDWPSHDLETKKGYQLLVLGADNILQRKLAFHFNIKHTRQSAFSELIATLGVQPKSRIVIGESCPVGNIEPDFTKIHFVRNMVEMVKRENHLPIQDVLIVTPTSYFSFEENELLAGHALELH